MSQQEFDAIVVGAGLAGLVATAELTAAGRHVAVVEQENRANLGGQAHWSFGGGGAVPRRLARAAPAEGTRFARPGLGRLAR